MPSEALSENGFPSRPMLSREELRDRVLFTFWCCDTLQSYLAPMLSDGRAALPERARCPECKRAVNLFAEIERYNTDWIERGKPIELLKKARARMEEIRVGIEPGSKDTTEYLAFVRIHPDLLAALRDGKLAQDIDFVHHVAECLYRLLIK